MGSNTDFVVSLICNSLAILCASTLVLLMFFVIIRSVNKLVRRCCKRNTTTEISVIQDELQNCDVDSPMIINPVIIGLANHLRENHSSTRNSLVSGYTGKFQDLPPDYNQIEIEIKAALEGTEIPPPSYTDYMRLFIKNVPCSSQVPEECTKILLHE